MNGSATLTKIRCERLHEGALWRVILAAPKGNVLDADMVRELSETFVSAAADPNVKAILLMAEGAHFSFGASVEEHLPDRVEKMLGDFHSLFLCIAASGIPVVAALRGACLGGGLELAAFCQRIFAAPNAKLGQPEIQLGVIAPVASAILSERIGRGAADDLLLSGRSVGAEEALRMRLVDEVELEPENAAQEWVEKHLLALSASSLRIATRAARLGFTQRFESLLRELEELYLEELMTTADAVEGIQAFLEKRKPFWRNR